MARDRRSYEIKRILRREFPDARFKVRIEKFSGGEAINVYTDALPEWPDEYQELKYRMDVLGESIPLDKWNEMEATWKKIEEVRSRIQELLRDYWHVAWDDYTNEILLGGNIYLHVEPWSKTRWLK